MEEARPLLLALLEEQHSGGPHHMMRADIARGLLGPIRPAFRGENLILAARDDADIVGLCWCVIFDPGSGLEGEVAEVFVQPSHRGRGLAAKLLLAAVDLFRERDVTFATVWTTPSNEAAVRLYQRAGFKPTDQLVLTWLPDRG
jgi:ribosomal protein S18 acetylase RimI-like enzyme